ncbi:MAG: amino acid permease [Clostridia bacterium]|nr:amino acid permease [Clostridia bacterium]
MKENQNQNENKIESLQSEETELKREIGLFGGISVLAGIMIGSGIFYIGSYVLIRTGMSIGLSLLVWVIGGIVTMISGICYAELGAMMPKAGGQYVYLREAFGEKLAFMSGFSAFLLGNTGSISALAVAFGMGISSYLGIGGVWTKLIAIIMVVLLTIMNIRGVKLGAAVQKASLVGKVIPVIAILLLGFFMGKEQPDLSLFPGELMEISPLRLLTMIAYATIATLWAYEGWTNLNVISEEIKNPKRNLPLAIILSIAGVTVLYTLFHFSMYNVLSAGEINASIEGGNYYIGVAVANKLLGNAGKTLISFGMLLSIFGALNGCVMAFPRTYYAMAQDGLFFSSFKKVHPTYKTPYNALIGSMIISIILISLRNLDQLTLLVIFSGNIFNALTFVSVLVLRKKYPQMLRPYKVWGGSMTVCVAVLLMLGMATVAFVEDPVNSSVGLIIPLIGLGVYEIMNKKRSGSKVE